MTFAISRLFDEKLEELSQKNQELKFQNKNFLCDTLYFLLNNAL